MKKVLVSVLVVAAVLSACTDKKTQQEQQELAEATRAELVAAVNDRDQLIELVSQISADMEQIKELENILSVPGVSETPNKREQIHSDIVAIQQTLMQRRQKLAELESKLAKSSQSNSNLKKTITSLRAQIDSQTVEIENLRASLGVANERIETLDSAVDSLNTTVNTVVAQLDSTVQENEALANELNLCYFAIGTKSELKDRKIIETGFLRKTKLMKGDFDKDFFTVGDKRNLTTIELHSNKAEVLTNQPAGSYIIEDADGQKVLRITNPVAFWSLSNYLVIKID